MSAQLAQALQSIIAITSATPSMTEQHFGLALGRIQALLARRRAMNVSGQAGEDIENIRAAFTAASTAEA